MPALKSVTNGKEIKIEYTVKVAPGIYFVDNSKQVKENCKNFNIEFEDLDNKNVLQNKISRFDKFSFLTLKAHTEYIQHIFFDTANILDIKNYAEVVQSETAPLIYLAALGGEDKYK